MLACESCLTIMTHNSEIWGGYSSFGKVASGKGFPEYYVHDAFGVFQAAIGFAVKLLEGAHSE